MLLLQVVMKLPVTVKSPLLIAPGTPSRLDRPNCPNKILFTSKLHCDTCQHRLTPPYP